MALYRLDIDRHGLPRVRRGFGPANRRPRSGAIRPFSSIVGVKWTFPARRAFMLVIAAKRGTGMRRFTNCSGCGKPLTSASAACLWCGQPKTLFSWRFLAAVISCLSFVAGLLAAWRRQADSA
jgi:hypothetical protein